MLSETKIKVLKPKEKTYKVTDRDGLYIAVSKTGLVTFRFDYQINGRRETMTIGKSGGFKNMRGSSLKTKHITYLVKQW